VVNYRSVRRVSDVARPGGFFAVVAARSYGRTRNAAILVQTAYLGLAAAWLLVAPGGLLGIEDPRLYRFLGAGLLLSLAWLLYLFVGRRLKWRGREILELAALPVRPSPDAFTGRPRPAGRAEYTRGEILSFAELLHRNHLAWAYREELSLDALCESLAGVFVGFLEQFKRGEARRIVERLDAVSLSPVS
jgi:hypothetical protein